MNAWWVAVGLGFLLGLGASVPPGPVNLEIARRIPRGGWLAGAAVGLGAVAVDLGFGLLLVFGLLEVLQETPLIRLPLSAVGACLLIWLGIGSIRASRKPPADLEIAVRTTPTAGFLTGVMLCSTSPYQAGFWLTAVPAIVGEGGGQSSGVVLGVFVATLAWVATWSTTVALASGGGRGPRIATITDLVGGGLLIAFGGLAMLNLAREAL